MKIKILVLVFAVCLVLSVLTYGAEDINITINGKNLESDTSAQVVDGRTMVPVRAIFEGVGAAVEWDSETKTVTGKMAENIVIMQIDSRIVSINGNNSEMDTSPLIIDGRTFAPARYVAESFGYDVEWDSAKKTVKISVNKNNNEEISSEVTEVAKAEVIDVEENEIILEPFYEGFGDTIYGEGRYEVSKEIPEGNYFVFAERGKFATIIQYQNSKAKFMDSEPDFYYNQVSYNDYVMLESNEIIEVRNGVIIPEENVGELDVSQNGVFRIGKDIPAGDYWIKLDDGYMTGCAQTYMPVYNAQNGFNLKLFKNLYDSTKEKTENQVKMENNYLLFKSGVDIYKDINVVTSELTNLKYDHKKPVVNVEDIDSEYNFSEVGENFKNRFVADFRDSIPKFDESIFNKNNKVDPVEHKFDMSEDAIYNRCVSFINNAANESERKFAELCTEIYFEYEMVTNRDNITWIAGADMGGITEQTSQKLRLKVSKLPVSDNIFKNELNNILKAESFKDCQNALNNIKLVYNGGGKGSFNMTNSSDLYKLVDSFKR